MTTDSRVVGVEAAKSSVGRLAVTIRNEYTQELTERIVDTLVIEHGTIPCDELYHELIPLSRNAGQTDLAALVGNVPQPRGVVNPQGKFELFRVGDAVASRNIHAAIYDSLRLCNKL